MSKEKKMAIGIALTSLISLFIICISMKVWEMDLTVPFATDNDGVLTQMFFKSIKENGLKGLWFNYRLGSPEFSTQIDTPFVDYLSLFEYWIALKLFPTVSVAIYAVYLFSYPLAAVSMYLLLNHLNINHIITIVLSILYSIAPYHFLRGINHITLTNYFVIPIGIILAILVLENEFAGGIPLKYKNSKSKKLFFYFSIAIVGLSNVYYSFFSMLIVLVAVVYKMINTKTIKPILNEIRVFVYMALFFLMGIIPKFIFSFINGKNMVACVRLPQETEMYALKIIQMLLPPSYTRVDVLNRITKRYSEGGFNINENFTASLGIVAMFGFISACIWFIYKYAGSRKTENRFKTLMDFFTVLILILILYCSGGGFGTIFSYIITPELRCLNRVSIVIVTLSVAIVGLIGNRLYASLRKRTMYVIMSIIFLVTLYLDVPLNDYNWQAQSREKNRIYSEFFSKIEESMEPDDSVYQLPMLGFPEEGSINKMPDYALLKGYIYTDNLKWSFGGVKGRDDIAMGLYIDDGMSLEFVNQILDNDFDGVYIDTDGFQDSGIRINQFYQDTLGLEPIISEDKKLYFYNLKNLD